MTAPESYLDGVSVIITYSLFHVNLPNNSKNKTKKGVGGMDGGGGDSYLYIYVQ